MELQILGEKADSRYGARNVQRRLEIPYTSYRVSDQRMLQSCQKTWEPSSQQEPLARPDQGTIGWETPRIQDSWKGLRAHQDSRGIWDLPAVTTQNLLNANHRNVAGWLRAGLIPQAGRADA